MSESAAAVRRRAPASAGRPARAAARRSIRCEPGASPSCAAGSLLCGQPCRDRYNPRSDTDPAALVPSRRQRARSHPTPSPSPAPLPPLPAVEPRFGVQATARALRRGGRFPELESGELRVARARRPHLRRDGARGAGRAGAETSVPIGSRADEPRQPAVSGLLLGLALLGSLLTLALFLAGDSGVALTARVVLIGVACAALVRRSLARGPR